ncbi:hypothetical protein D3C81_580600 [compost metagenome]
MSANLPAGPDNIFPAHFFAEHAHIVDNRSGVEIRVLLHETDDPVQLLLRQQADIRAVDLHAALIHIIEAGQQVDKRAFARSRRADNPDELARPDMQIKAVQHLLSLRIGEGDIVEIDPALNATFR